MNWVDAFETREPLGLPNTPTDLWHRCIDVCSRAPFSTTLSRRSHVGAGLRNSSTHPFPTTCSLDHKLYTIRDRMAANRPNDSVVGMFRVKTKAIKMLEASTSAMAKL